jgi:hypothetical protein
MPTDAPGEIATGRAQGDILAGTEEANFHIGQLLPSPGQTYRHGVNDDDERAFIQRQGLVVGWSENASPTRPTRHNRPYLFAPLLLSHTGHFVKRGK